MKRFSHITILGFILLIISTGCAPTRTLLESYTDNARQYLEQQKTDSAITSAKTAIDADPDNAGEAWYYLARSYGHKGETEKARNAYKRVLGSEKGFFKSTALNYHAWANYNLGTSYMDKEKDFDKAIAYFNKALVSNTYHTEFVLRRGHAYLFKGLYREALRDFDLVLSRERASKIWAGAYQGKVYAYLGLGDATKAFSLLQKAQQASPTYNKFQDEARLYYALGEEKKLDELVSRTGFLGLEYRNYTGEKSKGLKAVEVLNVLKDSPSEQAGLQQGDLIIRINGKPVQGIQEFSNTMKSIAPGTSVALQVRRKGKKKEISVVLGSAERLINKAALDKDLFIAPFLLKRRAIEKARLAEKNGELRNAFQIYSGYLRDESQRPLEYEQDIIERIITLYRRLDPPPAIPEEARRHAAKAQFYIKDSKIDEDYKKANAEFEQAAKVAPWWADIYFNYAIAQQNAGEYKGSIRSFKLFLRAAPNDTAVGNVRNTIYTLEAQAEKYAEIKRWEGRWSRGGSVLQLTTTGNTAATVYIKVGSSSSKSGYRPGDTKFSGTISDSSLQGKLIIQRADDANITRCFGAKIENDMTGQLSPDGQTIKLQYTYNTFRIRTCAITGTKRGTLEYLKIP